MRRFLTATASTKRYSTSGDTEIPAAVIISSFLCMPPMPLSEDKGLTFRSHGTIDEERDLFTTFVSSGLDIQKKDVFIIESVVYAVVHVELWPWRGSTVYQQIVLAK